MDRTLRNAAATALTGLVAGLAIAAVGDAASRDEGPAGGPSLFESLVLMKYGQGAFGESTSATGDTNDRHASQPQPVSGR